MNSRVIMTGEEIDLALKRIAIQILETNRKVEKIAIVGVYTCGVFLAKRLCSIIEETLGRKVNFGSLDITLYRDDWSLITQNPVVKTTDIPFDVNNAHVVLVDDVIFTGRTVRAAMDALVDYGRPDTIQLAVLVDRGGRELPIQPDYVGMKTEIIGKEMVDVVMVENDGAEDKVVVTG